MKLDGILPLKVSGSYGTEDLARADILMASLSAFGDKQLFGTFLVVTPDEEVEQVRAHLSTWKTLPIHVTSESVLVPELQNYPRLRGWRKQQILKLAAPRMLANPFFITFDADVFCTRPVAVSDLCPGEKALIQYENRSLHPKWWASSARILGVSPQVGDPVRGMSITPAILSREICKSLTSELTPRRGTWIDRLCRLHRPTHPSNWTLGRLLRSKWTEYSLYYLHGASTGMIDEFHVECGTSQCTQTLLGHEAHPFEHWQPAFTFGRDNSALFCLVGSKTGLPASAVWDKVQQFLPSGLE